MFRVGMAVFVLVAGPPGSGKTTLAVPLAAALGLPLIAKDVIKEVLMETLGWPETVEQSRVLGRAAVETMLAIAQTSPGAVLESNFSTYALPALRTLPGLVIEVRCRCPKDLALARYRDRAAHRHPGHLDDLRQESELWNEELLTPLGLGSLIEVETSTSVDVDALVSKVRAIASTSGE